MAFNLNTLTVFKASGVDNDPVTASVSPAADRLVLAIIAKRSGTSITADSVASSFDIVGTWQRAEFAVGGNRNQSVEIWYAVTDSNPGSGTVQVVWGANVGATIAIVEVEDAGEIGLTAKNTGLGNVQPSVTFSETPGATSLVIAAATATNESDGMTPDSNYTELLDEVNTVTNPVRLQVQYKIGGASTGVGWSDVSGESWAAVAIEIKPSGPDETAPALQSATISTDGESLSLAFDESVTIGSGGSGGFALDASGGAVTATYDSGDESSTLVYALSRAIEYDETVTLDYTQPGDGLQDIAGNPLASFASKPVTNNSTAGQEEPGPSITDDIVSSWTFNEESGGAADTLNVNNLSQSGTVARVAGKLGNAARLTGVGNQGLVISNANQTGLDIDGGPFSFEIVLRLNAPDNGVVLIKGVDFFGYALATQDLGGGACALGLVAPMDVPQLQLATVVSTMETWIHMVVTYDPVEGGVLYVDGEPVDTCEPVEIDFSNNGIFAVGSTSATPTTKADVDLLRRWNRALTSSEPAYLYNGGDYISDDVLFASEDSDVPANVTITDETASSISLSWDAVDGAESYNVYRDGILVGSTSGTSFTVKGLKWETQYSFTVTAIDAESTESDPSDPATGATDTKPVIKLALLGDSDTDEYRADDDRGQGEYKAITFNWSEILVNERSVDLGEWGTWGGVRRSGYERNWARSGHKLEDLDQQYPGAAGQIADGDANAVVIGIGVNDWKLANGLPGQIYNGTLSGSTLDALLDTHFGYLATAITALVDAGAAAVAVQHIPDEMLLPISWGEYDDAEKRQLVHDAIGSLNDLIDTLSVLYPCVVTLPVNEYLEDQLALVVDGFLDVGGVPIHAFEKGYAPNYMRLGDQSGHLGTVGNCLKINFILQNTESLWGLVSEPFSDEEILALVGLSSEQPVTASGTATGAGGTNAALLRSILIQAQAQGSGNATAAMRALRRLQALASGAGGTEAAAMAHRLLSASASGKGELSASALVSRLIGGSAGGTGGASATATVGGGHDLSALLSGSGGASIAARITRRLEGVLSGAGGASAAPQLERRLAGTASGVGRAEAFVGSALILAGIASGQGGASASVKRAVQALGIASGEGGASAELQQALEHGAGGTGSGAGSAAAAVMIRRFLEAAAEGVGQAQAGLIIDAPGVVQGPLRARLVFPARRGNFIGPDRRATLA